jgi:biotin synthase-like enzyme
LLEKTLLKLDKTQTQQISENIKYGEQLLTTDNPDTNTDQILFKRLGINQALSNPH